MRKILILALVTVFSVLGTAAVAGAKSRDRDRDRLPDKWEKKFNLNTKKNDARKDNDHDGLSNLGEFEAGDNPRDADTDNDGIKDGNENAGTIESFDATTGTLVITLAPNGSMTGKVDSTTEIECGNGDRHDNSGPGSDNSGPGNSGDDDNGNDDANDDNRGDDNGNCTTAALVKGAKVDEAELRGNGVFEKVELGS